jgi:hypothetical protein
MEGKVVVKRQIDRKTEQEKRDQREKERERERERERLSLTIKDAHNVFRKKYTTNTVQCDVTTVI